MSPESPNLDRLRIQTARMKEIFALLRHQLEASSLRLTDQQRDQLAHAIGTIARNVEEMQAHFARLQEDSSPLAAEATGTWAAGEPAGFGGPPGMATPEDIDGLLDAVLKWVMENDRGG